MAICKEENMRNGRNSEKLVIVGASHFCALSEPLSGLVIRCD
jgi:hypothetical protein